MLLIGIHKIKGNFFPCNFFSIFHVIQRFIYHLLLILLLKVTFHNSLVQLQNWINTPQRIGYTDESNEGNWISNGKQFIQWADGQPDNCCGGQNCAVLSYGANNGEMTDQSCGTDRYTFICQILKGPLRTTSSTTTTTTSSSAVPTVTTTNGSLP